jgi:hypothetical protein
MVEVEPDCELSNVAGFHCCDCKRKSVMERGKITGPKHPRDAANVRGLGIERIDSDAV